MRTKSFAQVLNADSNNTNRYSFPQLNEKDFEQINDNPNAFFNNPNVNRQGTAQVTNFRNSTKRSFKNHKSIIVFPISKN